MHTLTECPPFAKTITPSGEQAGWPWASSTNRIALGQPQRPRGSVDPPLRRHDRLVSLTLRRLLTVWHRFVMPRSHILVGKRHRRQALHGLLPELCVRIQLGKRLCRRLEREMACGLNPLLML